MPETQHPAAYEHITETVAAHNAEIADVAPLCQIQNPVSDRL